MSFREFTGGGGMQQRSFVLNVISILC